MIWRPLLRQLIPWALVFDLANTGNSIAARMAMMAMTTKSSIKVNPAVPLDVRFQAKLSLDIPPAYQSYKRVNFTFAVHIKRINDSAAKS